MNAATKSGQFHPVRIALNVLSGYLAYATAIIINFALVPALVSGLGDERYGLWRFCMAAVGYLNLLDLGLGYAVTYFVARYSNRPDRGELNGFVSTIFVVYATLALAAGAIGVGSSRAAVSFFHLPKDLGVPVVILAGLIGAVTLISSPFGGVLQGLQRYDVNNALQAATAISNGLVTLWLLRGGHSIVALLVLSVVLTSLAGVTRWIWIVSKNLVTLRTDLISSRFLAQAAGYGFWSFAIGLAARFSFDSTDTLVISRFLPLSQVTLYSIALAPLAIVNTVVYRFTDVFMPILAGQYDADPVRVGESFLLLIDGALLISMPFLLVLWGSGRTIISLWVGPEYVEAYRLLLLLSMTYLADYIAHSCAIVLMGIARHRVLAILALTQAAVNVSLSIVLVQRMGTAGVILGTLAGTIPVYLLVLPRYVCHVTQAPYTSYLKQVGKLLGLGGLLAVVWARGPHHSSPPWLAVSLNVLYAMVLFPLLAWFLALDSDQRTRAAQLFLWLVRDTTSAVAGSRWLRRPRQGR